MSRKPLDVPARAPQSKGTLQPLIYVPPYSRARRENEPTEKQEWFLRCRDLWSEHLTKEEASDLIRKCKFEDDCRKMDRELAYYLNYG
jgi:hypothetical protein